MIIIKNYHLEPSSQPNVFYLRSHEHPICPDCRLKLIIIGSRHRKVRDTDGQRLDLIIRRLMCPGCRRIHHELPDLLIPGKQYRKDCIEKIVQCPPDVLDVGCDSSTIRRIRQWARSGNWKD